MHKVIYFSFLIIAAFIGSNLDSSLTPGRVRAKDSAHARCLSDSVNRDEAIAACTTAIKENPEDAEAYRVRGSQQYYKGNDDLAIADYNEAIRINPQDVVSYSLRGDVFLFKKHEYERAIADFNKVLDVYPGDSESYHRRGMAFEAKGDLREALADYKRFSNFNTEGQEAVERVTKMLSAQVQTSSGGGGVDSSPSTAGLDTGDDAFSQAYPQDTANSAGMGTISPVQTTGVNPDIYDSSFGNTSANQNFALSDNSKRSVSRDIPDWISNLLAVGFIIGIIYLILNVSPELVSRFFRGRAHVSKSPYVPSDRETTDLVQAQRELSDKDLAIFNAELQRQTRSAIVAYILWFFLGSMGVHNFYMGKILWGLLYIGLMIIGWGLTIGGSDDSSELDPIGGTTGAWI
jgi:tetratricopeptide (TPR) repeat protein